MYISINNLSVLPGFALTCLDFYIEIFKPLKKNKKSRNRFLYNSLAS